MSTFVVVDASFAFKWLVREEHTDKALVMLRAWQREEIRPAAPHLLPFEVANALHKRVNRGELSVEGAVDLIGNLLTSQVELHQPWNLHGRALEIASTYGQAAAYDAHYLALAESLGCDFWTADEKFHQSVGDADGRVHWIGEFVVPE